MIVMGRTAFQVFKVLAGHGNADVEVLLCRWLGRSLFQVMGSYGNSLFFDGHSQNSKRCGTETTCGGFKQEMSLDLLQGLRKFLCGRESEQQ